MSAPQTEPPRAERWFLQVVDALTAERAAERAGDGDGDERPTEPLGRLLNLQDRVAFVQMDDGSVAAVIWPSLRGAALKERLDELLELDRVTPLKLVIVGGGDDMREVLQAAQPGRFSRRMVQVFHLRDDADVWGGRASRLDGPTGRILQRVGTAQTPAMIDKIDLIDRSTLQERVVPGPDPQEAERAAEHQAFIQRFRGRRPLLTRALVAFIALIFAFEIVWGGSEFVVTLVRLGANTDASLGSEPWRLLSSVSLHAGWLHLIVNGYVLYVLGSFMERIIGWSRLAVLYVAAGLAGALASAALSEALLSVGASGAIWGILGAAGALAFRPGTLLPRNLVGPMRRTTIINLLINLSVSFLPQVDIMAHLGGGIAGAALIFSGVLTRGLTAPTPEPGKAAEPEPEPESTPWKVLAAAMLLALVSSSAVAIGVGQPWKLVKAPGMQQQTPQPGLTVTVPEGLGVQEVRTDEATRTWVFGDVLQHPVAVAVEVQSYPGQGLPDEDWAEVEQWFYDLPAQPPEGLEPIGERKVIEDADAPTFEERFAAPNGLRMTIRYTQFRWGRVIVETAHWSDAPEPWLQTVEQVNIQP